MLASAKSLDTTAQERGTHHTPCAFQWSLRRAFFPTSHTSTWHHSQKSSVSFQKISDKTKAVFTSRIERWNDACGQKVAAFHTTDGWWISQFGITFSVWMLPNWHSSVKWPLQFKVIEWYVGTTLGWISILRPLETPSPIGSTNQSTVFHFLLRT